MKRCCACGETKVISEFYTNKGRPDGLQSVCKECSKKRRKEQYYSNQEQELENAREYRDEHREEINANAREYLRQHRNERKEYWKKYAEENAEQLKQRDKRRYEREKERINLVSRLWKRLNRARVNDYQRQYFKEHPEKLQEILHKRYAREKNADGEFTYEEWEALCAKYDYCCLSCGKQAPLTVDHIIPLSKGGSNDISNIQPLCKPCNSKKGTKIIDYRQ